MVTHQRTSRDYDILVIHSGPDPIPEAITEQFDEVTFLVFNERLLPGKARNHALDKTTANWVFFLDADCIVEPDWLENMLSAASTWHVTGVGGGVANANPFNLVSWVMHLLEFGEWLPAPIVKASENFPSCNAVYKREALLNVGGFPETIFPCEDTILNFKLRAAGYNLLCCLNITARHIHRRNLRETIIHNYNHGLTYRQACLNYDLPGHQLLHANRLVILCVVIPIRFFRTLFRTIPRHPALFLILLLLSPLIFLNLLAWGLGFVGTSHNRSFSQTP